jgi:hypothetical protein
MVNKLISLLFPLLMLCLIGNSQVYRFRAFKRQIIDLKDDNLIVQDFDKKELKLYLSPSISFAWYDSNEKEIDKEDTSHILYSYEFKAVDNSGDECKILENRMKRDVEGYDILIIILYDDVLFTYMANAIK